MSTSKVVIRQDELGFVAGLVNDRLSFMNAASKDFAGDVDKMEAHVKEYRMIQDIKGRLDRALDNYTAIIYAENEIDNTNNTTEGVSNE